MRIETLAARDVEWLAQIEVKQRASVPFIFPAREMIEAIFVKANQWVGRERLFGGILVPPGDYRRNVEVLGAQQELNLLRRTMHVQIAAPPAFGRQVRDVAQ